MFQEAKITAARKAGLVVCSQTRNRRWNRRTIDRSLSPMPTTTSGAYTRISELSALLSRRWCRRPVLCCGVPGRTNSDAMAVVRDTTAHANFKIKPFCTLSLDSEAIFNEISHRYFFRLLEACGYTVDLLRVLKGMYDGEPPSKQLNGFRSRPFPVRGSIRQGCTMSMILFTLVLNS